MIQRETRVASAEPAAHDQQVDWLMIAKSTLEPQQTGQQDPPDDPPTTDGGSG